MSGGSGRLGSAAAIAVAETTLAEARAGARQDRIIHGAGVLISPKMCFYSFVFISENGHISKNKANVYKLLSVLLTVHMKSVSAASYLYLGPD